MTDGTFGAAHQDGVLNLTNAMHQNTGQAQVDKAMSANYGGMSAHEHGAAAKEHWDAANRSSGTERAAHNMMGNWHAQQRESKGGRGMKT